jgi:hypothetical protein
MVAVVVGSGSVPVSRSPHITSFLRIALNRGSEKKMLPSLTQMSTIDAAILYVVSLKVILESLENLGNLGTLEEIQGVGFQTFIPIFLYSGLLISIFSLRRRKRFRNKKFCTTGR